MGCENLNLECREGGKNKNKNMRFRFLGFLELEEV